ncbi:MAG: type II secretion system protein GspM, partial [Longimicrobiales bacterium]
SARERRTIRLGLVVSLLALTLAFGVLPFARHLRAREDMISMETDRLARLRGLVANETKLRELVEMRSASLETGRQRLLSARTPALAASSLQSLLQGFADQSQITVSQLDVAGAPETADEALPMIPANVSAVGDIYGITDMLALIHHGSVVLEVVELTVRPNPALRGDLLQMNATLRGAYLQAEASR